MKSESFSAASSVRKDICDNFEKFEDPVEVLRKLMDEHSCFKAPPVPPAGESSSASSSSKGPAVVPSSLLLTAAKEAAEKRAGAIKAAKTEHEKKPAVKKLEAEIKVAVLPAVATKKKQ